MRPHRHRSGRSTTSWLESKADIDQPLLTDLDFMSTRPNTPLNWGPTASGHHALDELDPERRGLVGVHGEALEHVRTEGGAERHVGGIAPARHHDPADAGNVVPGIERVPSASEIARAIARRDVHAAAQ